MYGGATKLLQKAFYANYKYTPAGRINIPGAAPFWCLKDSQRKDIRDHASSAQSGRRFHCDVYHYFVCQKGVMVEGNARKRCHDCKKRFGVYSMPITNTCDAYAMINGLAWSLRHRGLFAVSSEVPVAWRQANTGTLLDLVCMDGEGLLHVVELKTGYSSMARTHADARNRWMTGGVGQRMRNCPLNHHMLQLWFGVRALEGTHTEFEVADGHLFYVSNRGVVSEYPLSKWKPGEQATLDDLEAQLLGRAP